MGADMRAAFAQVYAQKRWHNGSGSGSQPHNTVVWRAFLEGFIRHQRIWSVLDIGAGDMRVMNALHCWDAVKYTGVEIVPGLIHSSPGEIITADALEIDWPAADLVVIKDLVQHWPDSAVASLPERLSQYGHALIVTDLPAPGADHEDIEPGGYRPLRLPLFRELFRYTSQSLYREDTKAVYGW